MMMFLDSLSAVKATSILFTLAERNRYACICHEICR